MDARKIIERTIYKCQMEFSKGYGIWHGAGNTETFETLYRCVRTARA